MYLAAGYAKRFGDNKLLVPFHGKPLYLHGLEAAKQTVLRLREQGIEGTVLVVTAYEEVETYCKSKEIPFVRNKGAQNDGLASSIRKAVSYLNIMSTNVKHLDDEEYDLFLQADQPYLTSELLADFIHAFLLSRKGIGTMEYQKIRRSPNLFRADYRAALLQIDGDAGGKRVINANESDVFSYPVSWGRYFIDIDTMEEYMVEKNMD